jgi:hypothetical protein
METNGFYKHQRIVRFHEDRCFAFSSHQLHLVFKLKPGMGFAQLIFVDLAGLPVKKKSTACSGSGVCCTTRLYVASFDERL